MVLDPPPTPAVPEGPRAPASEFEPDGRKIIHIDMDAFYASVEERDDPELKGKPIVVGGKPDSRGVVASASYAARKHGVRSAMSSRQAQRLCPQAVFLYPNFDKYKEASEKIHAIFDEVTTKVEPLSLDEAFLDVTQNLWNEPIAREIAVRIKRRIREEVGLTASAGVGPNKFIAKVASDLRKPDGLVVVPPEKVLAFVEKLPVERLWGVGPATAKRLLEVGIRNAADIRQTQPEILEALLGKFGRFIHGLAYGVDRRPVETEWEPKSRGAETTFERDITNLALLGATLRELSQEVWDSLERMECFGRTVTLKVRYSDFSTITRSRTLYRPLTDVGSIAQVAVNLLEGSTEAGRQPIRLLGVSISHLLRRDEPQQLWFDFPLP